MPRFVHEKHELETISIQNSGGAEEGFKEQQRDRKEKTACESRRQLQGAARMSRSAHICKYLGQISKVCTFSGVWVLWPKVLQQCIWEACRVLQVRFDKEILFNWAISDTIMTTFKREKHGVGWWCDYLLRAKTNRMQTSPPRDVEALAKLQARTKYNPSEVAKSECSLFIIHVRLGCENW